MTSRCPESTGRGFYVQFAVANADMCTCATGSRAGDVIVSTMRAVTCDVRRPASVASSGYGGSSAVAMYDHSRRYRHAGEAAAVLITTSLSQ
jgi:hypothetical protein